jgi:hypothetical protein
MTTFDSAEVRGFTADLDARMDRCDNGEGMECATLDDTLRHYADLSRGFCDQVRRWADAVFAGQVAFDPEVERLWREEGSRLYSRAMEMWKQGQRADGSCFTLEGHLLLQAALWELDRLLKGWVTPKRSVSPAARRGLTLDPVAAEEVRRRIASLPPLPADWQPADPRQQALYRKLRRS